MTDIILRFSDGGMTVYAVNPDYVEYNTEPCTDLVLTFDDAGTFVTAKLVKRNEEHTSENNET